MYAWTVENDAKTVRKDANFLENGEKKLLFKRMRIRADRALMRSGRLIIMQTSEKTCERTCHKDKEAPYSKDLLFRYRSCKYLLKR